MHFKIFVPSVIHVLQHSPQDLVTIQHISVSALLSSHPSSSHPNLPYTSLYFPTFCLLLLTLIHSFNSYFLSISLGQALLGIRNPPMNITSKNPCLLRAYILAGRQTIS